MSQTTSPPTHQADTNASDASKTNMNAMMVHLQQFVKHESGLDQPNVQLGSTDEDLDLSVHNPEDFFYAVGRFWCNDLKMGNGKPYAISTILMWMSALLEYFKRRVDTTDRLGPMIMDKHNHLIPQWLTPCRTRLKRDYGLKYIVNGAAIDEEDDMEDTEALYSKQLGPYLHRFVKVNNSSFIENAEMRFSCLLQFHNSSRGGELRHTMWSGKRGAKWDKHLELLAWGWIESKGIKSYPLACIPHACNYDMCMVHGLAVYCLAGGLGREDPSAPKANSVIFSLQRVQPDKVSTVISGYLPGDYTSKSLRKSSITEMETHPNTKHGETILRSGHSAADVASGSYVVYSVATSYPGGMALSGFANPHARVTMAKLPLEIVPLQAEFLDAMEPPPKKLHSPLLLQQSPKKSRYM